MKITDSPGAMLVMPFKATAEPKALELSSIFHPVMFAALAPVLVTSNQSAATGAAARCRPGCHFGDDDGSRGE